VERGVVVGVEPGDVQVSRVDHVLPSLGSNLDDVIHIHVIPVHGWGRWVKFILFML